MKIAWMLEEARRKRAAEEAWQYAAVRAKRRPWITLAEAAFELDVTEGRISQLTAQGKLRVRKDPFRPRGKLVLAFDVYAYRPRGR